MNWTLSVIAWPGSSLAGKLAPEKEKPAPARTPELTVTGAVPVEVRVNDCVTAVLATTLPNVRLDVLILNDGAELPRSSLKVLELFPAVATSVAV